MTPKSRPAATPLALVVVLSALAPVDPMTATDNHVRALVVDQVISGIPGMKPGEFSRQRLTFDIRGNRLVLTTPRRDARPGPPDRGPGIGLSGTAVDRVILHLNSKPPLIYEVDDASKEFTVQNTDLNKIQEERDQFEIQILEAARRRPRKERERIYKEQGLREDGKRIVKVTRGTSREIHGYHCLEFRVTENDRLVIHAWVTTQIEGARSFYELYRSLGAFSREVLDGVKGIPGLPLEARIKVITTAPSYDIDARCEKISTDVNIPAEFFDRPKNYKKIEEQPGIVPCGVCGKDVERKEPEGGYLVHPITRREFCVCSRACRKRLKARFNKIATERFNNEKSGNTPEKP